MKSWRKRLQAWWMSSDSKPKGKERRLVEKMTRSDLKKQLKIEVKQYEQDQTEDAQRAGTSKRRN